MLTSGTTVGATGRPFDVRAVETKWQHRWRADSCHEIGHRPGRPLYYNFVGGPFPNGSLHMGHVRTFALGDVVARHRRMRGHDVLHCFEFDAFGLPNELAADAAGVSPADLTGSHIATMRREMEELGFSYDWRHVHETCDPRYYRGTQDLFLLLWRAGLIYRAAATVDYCPSCRTALAHMQVVDGRCWRCETEVESRRTRQWFVRTSAHNEVLHRTIDDLTQWSPAARGRLRGVLGRTAGIEVDLPILDTDDHTALTVFATGPAAFGADCVLIAGPASDQVEALLGADRLEALVARSRRVAHDAPAVRGVRGAVDSGVRLANPVGGDPIPLLVGAAHDGRFATGVEARAPRSGEGPSSVRGARSAVHYRVHDWSISRQRRWGTPVPMVECARCGDVPTGVEAGTCAECGADATADGDTLDCFFDVLWCFIACASADVDRMRFDEPVTAPYPVDWFHNGTDSFFYLHLYRFLGRVLYELGQLPGPEPISRYDGHGTVRLTGVKMSKHHRTSVAPGPLVAVHGADVLRLHVLGAARPGRDLEWSDVRIDAARRLIDDVWQLVTTRTDAVADTLDALPGSPPSKVEHRVLHAERRITALVEGYQFSGCVEELRLLVEHLARASRRSSPRDDRALGWAAGRVIRLLAPFCPHVAEELWERVGGTGFVALAAWPDGVTTSAGTSPARKE